LEKKQFHTLVTNYTCLTREEANLLILLEKEFPYSQVIHSLTARATQDNQLPEKDDQLHLGAIYTTDRGIFKSIMTEAKQERKQAPLEIVLQRTTDEILPSLSAELPIDSKKETEISIEIISVVLEDETPSDHDVSLLSKLHHEEVSAEDLYNEIEHDLAKLKELKHSFEETVKQLEGETLQNTTLETDTHLKKKINHGDPTEELLTEIKISKKKVKPEGTKQKEQIEIIEQFIKTQPTIKGKVASDEKAAPKDDLSEKNLTYNENIISETLAEILIKQGKKEKAIEVLKKLIWKFPQKKAYFAAQIEDLKK